MTVWQDLKYGWRQLMSAPGFAVIAVTTFALGIGATTAIFSAVYAVVLQPFPFPEPDRVVAVGERFRGSTLSAVSPGNFTDWRSQASSFSELAARSFVSVNMSTADVPERVLGAGVTHNYFSVFQVPTLLGRTFTPDEDRPGGDPVVVLSHRLWVRRFAANPAIVGSTIQMDGAPRTVIGVMSATFDRLGNPEELWLPAAFTPEEVATHDAHSMTVVGRLATGVSLEQAAAELPVIFNQVKAQLPGNNQIREGLVATYASQAIGESRERLLVLFGAVALVMLIACGNVAHLLLARGRLRTGEVALRASLGASRGRVAQQFLTESLVLALIGGAVGTGVTYAAVPALLAISPADIPRLDQTMVNLPVLLFGLGATLLSAVVTGIIPALRASRPDLRATLGEGGRTVARANDTLRNLLVATEVALAIVLLTGAGLLVRSALYLQSVDVGIDGQNVLTARVSLPASGYAERERVEQAFLALVDRLSQTPGVEAAAVSSSAPMAPGGTNNGLVPEGKVFDPDDFVLGRLGIASNDYFRALRIPLIAGRTFRTDDRRDSPRVMILSEGAARSLFPGENAIGKRVACCEPAENGAPSYKEVVGIVGDVRADGPGEEARSDFYLPITQAPADAWAWLQRTMTVVVRGSDGSTGSLTAAIRDAVRAVDPSVPVHSVATIEQRMGTALARDRFNTTLMLLLGAIGLVLSAIGIYGVITCAVTHRRHEIAIRVALGARSGSVVGMVLHQGMLPVWVGVVVGVFAAMAATQTMSGSVHGVTTTDPLTFAAAVGLLVVSAMLANLLPARAAARVNPATLLGH
jgi:putative ABC transport system permease protein